MSRTGARAAFGWQLDHAVTGVHRSGEPPGVLPYLASRLDPDAPPNDHEVVLDIERLNVDATSYRVIRDRADGDPERMADMLRSIVARSGKLQNPWTGSGGVLVGRVRIAGPRSSAAGLPAGTQVVPLVSLVSLVSLVTLPLRLDEVGPVDPATPQVPVRGRAVVVPSAGEGSN